MSSADSLVILDFETTGLSPQYGDRAIEVGAVRLEAGAVVERFQRLMNPGFRISSFIEGYTGITNEMLRDQPSCREVMGEFADFLEGRNIVAHNLSFDLRFLESELKRIGRSFNGEGCCSLLLSRRIIHDAPNHKLGTLVSHLGIPLAGRFHRALADAEVTTGLWLRMLERIGAEYGVGPLSFSQLLCLNSTA